MKQVQGSDNKTNWKISATQAGIRREAFVRLCLPHLSRRQSMKAIAEKAFSINGKAVKKGHRLEEGDIVTFDGIDDWLTGLPRPSQELHASIVYEDAEVLAVNKPAGMATHGFSGRDRETLANFLIAARPGLSTVGKSRWEPGLVNRLDRETSGLVLVAKTQQAFEHLRAQFRHRQIAKSYLALVWGDAPPCGTISFPLVHDSSDKGRMQAMIR
ncbi:MAG: RluA family pseudouridine synthase, partial [Candidatus Binatia bacterium]